jgi:hypothetical protein
MADMKAEAMEQAESLAKQIRALFDGDLSHGRTIAEICRTALLNARADEAEAALHMDHPLERISALRRAAREIAGETDGVR